MRDFCVNFYSIYVQSTLPISKKTEKKLFLRIPNARLKVLGFNTWKIPVLERLTVLIHKI